jgi:signal peptidase II
MYENKNKFLPAILILLVFIDQLSKYLIRHFDGFYICNPGISFGLIIHPAIFWLFWTIIIMALSYYIRKNSFDIGALLILAGALSNIFDRLYLSCVIDFIDLRFWPIFNLADSFIVIGVIMLLIRTTDSH